MNTLRLSTAAIDGNFLDTLREGFVRGYDPVQIWRYAALVLGAALTVLVLGLAWRWVRARFFTHVHAPGWVVNPVQVMRILREALDQRAKFDLGFLPAEEGRPSVPCTLLDMDGYNMILEMSGLEHVDPHWIDKPVQCYFKIRDKKKRPLFFRLASRIVGVNKTSQDLTRLAIHTPQALERRQKRSHLRLEPTPQLVQGLILWPVTRKPDGKLETDTRNWGQPVMVISPDSESPGRVDNISAGGIKLMLDRSRCRDCLFAFAVSQTFFLLMELADPASDQPLRFRLKCRVKSSFDDFQARHMEAGLMFTHLAVPDKDDPRLVRWTKLDNDGVEPLAGWVMKRHLEIFRETGVA